MTRRDRERDRDIGALLLRAFAGLALAFAHGIGKMPPSEGFVGVVAGLGFPAPGAFAWAASSDVCAASCTSVSSRMPSAA